MKQQTEYFYPNYGFLLFPVGLGGLQWIPVGARKYPPGPTQMYSKINGSKPSGKVVVHLKRSHSTEYEPPNVFWAAWSPLQTSTSIYLNFNLQGQLQFHF